MGAIDRSNAQAFNDAEKYTNFVLMTLPEIMLPDNLYRNVTDFGDGDVLNIPVTGTVTIQDVAEGVPLDFTNIDSSTITLTITDYVGDAWAVSDEVRQDYRRISQLEAARAMESTRALAEYQETRLLETCNQGQVDGDPNLVNGVAHRYSEPTGAITLDAFRLMKFAFDKARAPQNARIAIVDPSVEFVLNASVQVVTQDNPQFQGIITTGFEQNHRFIRNIYGWDIWTSDFCERGAFSDGTTQQPATGVANVFMSVASDQSVPVMYAERVAPTVEGWRDPEERRDKFQTTQRNGWGIQRADTLGIVLTDADQSI